MSDMANFTLAAGCICVPINILELCSWLQLKYLKTVWSFQILLSRCINQDQTKALLGLVTHTEWGKTLCVLYPVLVSHELSQPPRGTSSSQPHDAAGAVTSNPPRWIFSKLCIVSSRECADQDSAKYWRGTSTDRQSSASLFSHAQSCELWPSSSLRWSSGFSSLPRDSDWKRPRKKPGLVLRLTSPRNNCSSMSDIQCLQRMVSYKNICSLLVV